MTSHVFAMSRMVLVMIQMKFDGKLKLVFMVLVQVDQNVISRATVKSIFLYKNINIFFLRKDHANSVDLV